MANEMILTRSSLPVARVDLDLLEAVNQALRNLDQVRETGLALQINILDEVVAVSGVVLSRSMRQAVLHTIAQVAGVSRVVDWLYTDTDLAMAVSQALAVDPLTRKANGIRVTSYRGQVTLAGKVSGANLIQAASRLTLSVPGVRAVVSRLTLPSGP